MKGPPCKHKDPSLGPEHLIKKLGMGVRGYDPRAKEAETGGSPGLAGPPV